MDVDSGPADPTELGDPAPYDPETAIWLGVYWPGFAKEVGKGLGMATVGIVTYPITLLRNYGKYQGYHGNGPIGVPNLDASIPIPSSSVPVIGSIIAAKNSKGLDRAGHISGAVGQAALFGVMGLNKAGYNPTIWGGKSSLPSPGVKLVDSRVVGSKPALPTKNAIVKYDPKFAEWQEIRLAKNIIRANKNWKGYEGLMDLIDRSRVRSMTPFEIAAYPKARGLFEATEETLLYKRYPGDSAENVASTLLHEGSHELEFLRFNPKMKFYPRYNKFIKNFRILEYKAYRVEGFFLRDVLKTDKLDFPIPEALSLGPEAFIEKVKYGMGWDLKEDFSDPIDSYIDFDYYGL